MSDLELQPVPVMADGEDGFGGPEVIAGTIRCPQFVFKYAPASIENGIDDLDIAE